MRKYIRKMKSWHNSLYCGDMNELLFISYIVSFIFYLFFCNRILSIKSSVSDFKNLLIAKKLLRGDEQLKSKIRSECCILEFYSHCNFYP